VASIARDNPSLPSMHRDPMHFRHRQTLTSKHKNKVFVLAIKLEVHYVHNVGLSHRLQRRTELHFHLTVTFRHNFKKTLLSYILA